MSDSAAPVRWIDRLDDWINPIVVKELRQAVASKFVIGMMLFFLVVQLGALGLILMFTDSAGDFAVGSAAFMTLLVILLIVGLLFVPIYAGVRLAAERSDTYVDLIYITTLRPGSVIWGKFLSALVIIALLYSVAMPFMALTSLLRGIDLPSIFLVLSVDFMIIAASTMACLFLASVPGNRLARAGLALFALGMLASVFGWAIGANMGLLEYGGRIFGPTGAQARWWMMLSLVLLNALCIGFFLVVTMAMVSPPSANRALPVRVYLLVSYAVVLVFLSLASTMMGLGLYEAIGAWVILAGMCQMVMMFAAVSERDHWGSRIRGTIPRRQPGRIAAWLFYSGAPGGICWTILVFVSLIAVAWGIAAVISRGGDLQEVMDTLVLMFLYVCAYCLPALWLRRTSMSRRLAPGQTWAVALVLAAIGCTLPFVLALFMNASVLSWSSGAWYGLAPVPFAWIAESSRLPAWAFAGGLTMIGLVLNARWMIEKFGEFRRLESEAGA